MDSTTLQRRLAALAERYGVVGASVALAVGDETTLAATGVLNLRTGAPASTESVFQIGSITKVWTATLVMQLVDEALLDLDTPLLSYLPDFRVRDEEITAGVTARHLLNHTSGIAGDFFADTGRGDDAIARYVARLPDLPVSYPLGATTSYCNAGFVLLGRLVEVLRGQTWDTVLRERLFAPLGLSAAGTLPEEALLRGAAVGHFGTEVAPQWGLPRAIGPAGLIHARATDLLDFARMHLADGVGTGGERVLSARSAQLMREPHAAVIEARPTGAHFGFGWMLNDWGRPVFGHDGQTLGQSAYLQIVPGPVPVSIALLTNSNDSAPLFQHLVRELLAEHTDVAAPPPLEPPPGPVLRGSADIVGDYERALMGFEVRDRAGELVLIARPSGVLAASLGTDRIESRLVPFAGDAYLTQIPGRPGWLPVVFYRLADGTGYLQVADQAAARAPRPTA